MAMPDARGNAEAVAPAPDDVYQHLGRIVDRVITDKPQDAYSLFEVISRMIKESSDAAGDGDAIAAADSAAGVARVEYAKLLKQFDAVPMEEDAEKALCAVPDCVEDGELLSWAGVGLGELEFYKVACSLRALAAKETADSSMVKIRFWGKILGTGADYYVAEAQLPGGDVDPEAEDAAVTEAPGAGVNTYTYYVTTDLCKPWTKLPDLRPRHITSARRVKKLVTGTLSSKVITHPSYPGDESFLLRAQIARITADTVLCPKDFLKRDEEAGEDAELEENQEFVCPLPSEMMKRQNWTHMMPHILGNGRTTHLEVPEEEDENPELNAQILKQRAEIEADPRRDIIRGLDGDGLAWTIKQSGDDALYESGVVVLNEDGKPVPQPPRCNAVTCVRSLTWPGAVTALRGGRFVSFYVGYGLPSGEPDFFFPAPLDIQDEPPDVDEQAEPQGPPPEEAVPEE